MTETTSISRQERLIIKAAYRKLAAAQHIQPTGLGSEDRKAFDALRLGTAPYSDETFFHGLRLICLGPQQHGNDIQWAIAHIHRWSLEISTQDIRYAQQLATTLAHNLRDVMVSRKMAPEFIEEPELHVAVVNMLSGNAISDETLLKAVSAVGIGEKQHHGSRDTAIALLREAAEGLPHYVRFPRSMRNTQEREYIHETIRQMVGEKTDKRCETYCKRQRLDAIGPLQRRSLHQEVIAKIAKTAELPHARVEQCCCNTPASLLGGISDDTYTRIIEALGGNAEATFHRAEKFAAPKSSEIGR